ncbi:MAG: PD40 domain-containing protein [Deltaproteobacteria bacterium]|nr:PD40 domain-containing protein [Deltaproteobacteria bacterium]
MKTFSMIISLGYLGLGACYSPGYKDCEITCASGACPSGLSCASGVCRSPGQSGACNVTPGDGPDSDGDPTPDGPPRQWRIIGEVALPFPAGVSPIADDPTLTSDLLEMYVVAGGKIWHTLRSTPASPWLTAMPEMALSSNYQEDAPHITGDGKTMYFASNRLLTPAGAPGSFDVWVAERDAAGTWAMPVLDRDLSPATTQDSGPGISDDRLTVVLDSDRAGQSNRDLFVSVRGVVGAAWAPPQAMANVNTAADEVSPVISADRRTLYFQVTDPATREGDLWMATRPDGTQPFGTPSPITKLNAPDFSDEDPWVSPDGNTMFFASNRGGNGMKIWEAHLE